MFVVIVNQPVKEDENVSDMMLNAQSLICANGNVLPNKYKEWHFQDYWDISRSIEIRITS